MQTSEGSQQRSMTWRSLPRTAQLYVAIVITIGGALTLALFPLHTPQPFLFAALLLFCCLTSAWKVDLQLLPTSGSTLSVSYAAALMALVLLGPAHATVIAAAGAWTQCTFKTKQPYPIYRTVFSMATAAITLQASGWAYFALGGSVEPQHLAILPKPLVGAISLYFFVNTGLVAGAIALSVRRSVWQIWRDNFLWSGPSFMVAGAAGALAAVAVVHDGYWLAILALAPVYLTYRTYWIFLGRIEDERRHAAKTRELHSEAVEALSLAVRAERALLDEKERLSVTLRSIGDGVITTDLDGMVALMNNAAETLTGWTEQEAVGRPLAAVLQRFDRRTRQRSNTSVPDVTRNPQELSITRSLVLVARDLTERPIEEITAPIRDSMGQTIGMVVAFRDITDTLKAQEELARESKLASLGLLAAGIAHDFNNILMAIMGNVSLARVMVPSTAPAATALADAVKACVHARELTWQLLTFSKGGVPVKKTIDISRVLKECTTLAQCGSHVSSSVDIAPSLWPVHADPGQLIQVFNNILINAQQAMPNGGTIEVRVENIVEPSRRYEYALPVEAGRYVRVSIIDRGIGIPEENLGSIFDPYFTTKQKGSGLGLATSYSIVKNHGGYVSVDSKLGVGTTVQVNFPAATTREAEESVEPADLVWTDRGRVLVMDDDPAIRTLTANMLEFLGFEAEVAVDGGQAVEYYRRALSKGRPFDSVILDLIVPGGMGAKETVAQLSELHPGVHAILASGYAQDPAVTEYRENGFRAAIAKPFTLEELSRTLGSIRPDGHGSLTVH
jgi:PAS domain S-box-containing protein